MDTSNAERRGEPDYLAPPLPDVRYLSPDHRAHLYTSGLTDATIEAARVFTIVGRDDTIAMLGRTFALHEGPAIAIPFFEPGVIQPYAYRVRPDAPRVQKDPKTKRKRPVKYDQPMGEHPGLMVYYPPRTLGSGELQGTGPLYLTEGEKKALALDQLGLTAVGLTGVDTWCIKGTDTLHPRLTHHVRVAGRQVVLVWDNDALSKAAVMAAAHRLAHALLAAGAAAVGFITPPDMLPHKGIDDYLHACGAEAVRECLARASAITGDNPALARDTPAADVEALSGAPLPPGAVVPRGYAVNAYGRVTCAAGERTIEVSPRPIMVTRRYADHASGEQHADVCWPQGAGWQRAQVTRRALIDAKAMVTELGPLGAPVTSGNARYLTTWFLAWELANADVLPLARSVAHAGWVGEPGARGTVFVTGDPGAADAPVVLMGELERVAQALRPRGDVEAHTAALREAWRTGPVMRRVLCATLAAPLLLPMGLRGFAMHLCGDSSRGKTSMLRIAASVYGDPDDPYWVATWNTTANAAELRAATLCDLPAFYDEVGASDPEAIQRLIYTLTNGESRGRLTGTASAQRARSWRTVVISSGEASLAAGLATGAQARVLTLLVEGFGSLDGNGPAIDSLRQRCAAHAGSFGAQWLSGVAAQGAGDWAAMRAQRAKHRAKYLGSAQANGLRSRTADYYSLLALTEEILVSDYGFYNYGEDGSPSMCIAVRIDGVDIEPVSTAADAMADEIDAWIASKPDAFPPALLGDRGQIKPPKLMPGATMLGIRVYTHEGVRWETLINPRALRALFDECGRSYTAVVREWTKQKRIRVATDRPETIRTVEGLGRSRWLCWLGGEAGASDEK